MPTHRFPRWRRIHPLTVLLACCGLFIIYGTTLPFDFSERGNSIALAWRRAVSLETLQVSKSDVVSNILLFMPWGGLLAARLALRRVGLLTSLLVASASGAALSAFVETVQIFAPTRITSVIDLATNTFGSAVGAAVGWPWARRAWPSMRPWLIHQADLRPIATLAATVAAVYFAISLAPFDLSIDVGDLRASVKAARPIPFGPPLRGPAPAPEPWKDAGELLVWSLIGGCFALALREAGRHRLKIIVWTTCLAEALALTIELAQLAVRSHGTDATSVAMAVAGAAAAGVAIASRPGLRPLDWTGPALVAWAATVLIAQTAPLGAISGVGRLDPSGLIPFFAYYRRTDAGALANVFEEITSFLPLGLLLAARSPRWTPWRAALVGGTYGLALEMTQIFNATRYADVTDALVAAAGAWFGCSLWTMWGQVRR